MYSCKFALKFMPTSYILPFYVNFLDCFYKIAYSLSIAYNEMHIKSVFLVHMSNITTKATKWCQQTPPDPIHSCQTLCSALADSFMCAKQQQKWEGMFFHVHLKLTNHEKPRWPKPDFTDLLGFFLQGLKIKPNKWRDCAKETPSPFKPTLLHCVVTRYYD